MPLKISAVEELVNSEKGPYIEPMEINGSKTTIAGNIRLVMGSLAIFDAELAGDREALARLLQVSEIIEWPPIGGEHNADAVVFFRQTLEGDPEIAPWLAYYVCSDDELVGSAGFMGPPQDGTAEIGYSICMHARRKGFAKTTVELLAQMAKRENLHTMIAHVRPENAASIAVLGRVDFTLGHSVEGEDLLFIKQLNLEVPPHDAG